MTGVVHDAEARRRIREDLDATLFVEAAAGTGKTTMLVSRILSLLRMGRATLDSLVAVTFTEKAAGEMKLRLREEIERARADAALSAAERAHLEAALAELEIARIGTIHAFCADLLHERPVEAGVDPLFQVAPEDEAERLLDRAFDDWFQATLASPGEGVRRALRRRARGPNALGPRAALRRAAASLAEHRDFDAPWRREPFDRRAAVDALLSELAALGELAGESRSRDDWLGKNLENVQRFVEENTLRESVRERDYDGLEADLHELARRQTGWHWRGRGARYGAERSREEVMERRDAVKARLDAFLREADADLAPRLRDELRPVIDAYEAQKMRSGVLDFIDLLVRARDLLRGDATVRRDLQRRFTHFFVDEFQDTDPLQAEIVLLLAADDSEGHGGSGRPVPGKLFLVGDPKQSIYRFRRADIAVYEATKRRLVEAGADVVHLSTSFRSVPSLQEAVNAAFAPVMRGSRRGSQADYVPLREFREDPEGRPALVALPVPRPYADWGNRARITQRAIEESFPDAVGAFVDWLVGRSGWRVAERDRREPVPIAPRHVCLLLRRFKSFGEDVTRPYVRALEARRIPHVLVGGRSFHDREEVLALRNALCAIEWPDDELRVFATLRGPFFALGDDALLAFRDHFGGLHPLRRPDPAALEGTDAEVADALAVLRRLHVGRNHRPIARTIEQLLAAVRAHAGIAIWPTGEQALANCLRTIDLARRFERRGAPSFRAFVERLEADAERGEAQDAPVVEEGTEGVRIMTVHRAKGLEFPVVILADPTCNATSTRPSRHVEPERRLLAEPLLGAWPRELLDHEEEELERDREEATRLAYVAATRARDLLVVPVVGDEEMGGWLDVLHPAVYPDWERRREARRALGCPDFGDDSVEVRPDAARRGARASVAPGAQVPRAGRHRVVWWDPKALELRREVQVGLRQQRILAADEGGGVAESGIRAHARWQTRRRDALEGGGRPSLEVRPVTQLAASEEMPPEGAARPETPVELVRVERAAGDRPHGRRFGTLVHATLAAVPLAADGDAVRAVAEAQGRLVGASELEVEAAARAAASALRHPLFERAARSAARGELRRETPVLLRLASGALAEGVVDLAFREADVPRWTVVDFKTDREIGTHRREYESQVRLYAAAIQRATGEATQGVLLVL